MGKKISAYAPAPKHRIITQEAYPFILAGVILFIIACIFKWLILAIVFASVTVFICFFFRNPARRVTNDPLAILAPADGKIIAIEDLLEHPLLGCPTTKISTFMSVFNCHVNRACVSGIVESVIYHPGSFLVASLDKASDKNERNSLVIRDQGGKRLVIAQIAGLIARRIVCYLKEGMSVEKAARIGLIQFGSRVDIYLPRGSFELIAKKGDKVKAGVSIIGRWI